MDIISIAGFNLALILALLHPHGYISIDISWNSSAMGGHLVRNGPLSQLSHPAGYGFRGLLRDRANS